MSARGDLRTLFRDLATQPLDSPGIERIRSTIQRGTRMRRLRRAVRVIAASMLCAGFAFAISVLLGPRRNPPAAFFASASPHSRSLYAASGTVLQRSNDDPVLCVGGVLSSAPPQCGGLVLRNWHWQDGDGSTRLHGTRWGTYYLVGDYEDGTFTIRSARSVSRPSATETPFAKTACEPPAGGWQAPDAGRETESDLQAAMAIAGDSSDIAGLWISDARAGESTDDPRTQVLNVTFTGSVDEHRQALRRVWGGNLCVAYAPRSRVTLERVAEDLKTNGASTLGIRILGVAVDPPSDTVELDVLIAPDGLQSELDSRYGQGSVAVTPMLRPV